MPIVLTGYWHYCFNKHLHSMYGLNYLKGLLAYPLHAKESDDGDGGFLEIEWRALAPVCVFLHVKAAAFSFNPIFFSPSIIPQILCKLMEWYIYFFFIIFPHGIARKMELNYMAKYNTGCESLLRLYCPSRAAEPVPRDWGDSWFIRRCTCSFRVGAGWSTQRHSFWLFHEALTFSLQEQRNAENERCPLTLRVQMSQPINQDHRG